MKGLFQGSQFFAHMRDLDEYLRAYWAYVSTGFGWWKALLSAIVWLAGLFAPLAAKTLLLFNVPGWFMIIWMLVWAVLGHVFTPYGMWKHHRVEIANSGPPELKESVASDSASPEAK